MSHNNQQSQSQLQNIHDDEHHTGLDGEARALLNAGRTVKRGVSRFWDGFTDFAVRDNVLEVGLGVVLAAAFTAVVTSFVRDILTPILGLLPFIHKNLEEKFAVLRHGQTPAQRPYNTLHQALADGAVVLAYGSFLNQVFNFLGVGLSLYAIARVYGWVSTDSVIKHTVKCAYCRKSVGSKARRCVNCTSWLDGREG